MAYRRIPQDLLKKAITLYESGMSIKDAATLLGVHKSTVRYWLFISGVQTDRGARISSKMKGRRWAPGRKPYVVSAEERQRRIECATGNKWCVGRKVSNETREKMSIALRGKYRKYPPRKNGEPSEEKKQIENLRQTCKRFVTRTLKATGKRKLIPSERYLGYSKHDLLRAIGPRPKGHELDHRVPIVEFFRRGIVDPSVINAIANLQWLPKLENILKSDTVPEDADTIIKACLAPTLRKELLTAHFEGGRVMYSAGLA